MFHFGILLALLQVTSVPRVACEKQQLALSDSYLPVAMQVIAHLTDQMAFETKDEPTKPAQTTKPQNDHVPTYRPTLATNRPTSRPTYQTTGSYKPTTNGWWLTYTTRKNEQTTPFHKPGLYAPESLPDGERVLISDRFVLFPIDNNADHTVAEPQARPEKSPLFPQKNSQAVPSEYLVPPEQVPISRSDDEEFTEEHLQYLSPDIKDMLKLAHDPNDERLIDIWAEDGERKGYNPAEPKAKLSQSNLRLLLLYDLLSREAKRQKLSDYNGFSPSVLKELSESSSGGARRQLSFVLSRMLERNDCQHDYANNRAREMTTELGKDETKLSSEIRYLQPLVYKL